MFDYDYKSYMFKILVSAVFGRITNLMYKKLLNPVFCLRLLNLFPSKVIISGPHMEIWCAIGAELHQAVNKQLRICVDNIF